MSTSDNRTDKFSAGRMTLIYICISLFCGMFSAIYERLSYNVYSDFMVYMFAFPLIGGVLPFAALGLFKKLQVPSPMAARLYNSGIAALTLGSCVKGVLDIYGTSSVYVSVYWIAGTVLVGLGLTIHFYQLLFRTAHKA